MIIIIIIIKISSRAQYQVKDTSVCITYITDHSVYEKIQFFVFNVLLDLCRKWDFPLQMLF